jgi:cytochrome b561
MMETTTRTEPATGSFGAPLIAVHWLVFALMACAYATMEFRGIFPRGSDGRLAMRAAHYALGLSVLALVLVRVPLRLSRGAPGIVPAPPAWQAGAAKLGHLALYALMIVLPVLGWLAYGAEGRVATLFGIALPMPIAPHEAWVKPLEAAHEVAGKIGYALVGLHAAAALWHHYVVRDNTLALMWPPSRRR